jgi:hypothetical protein
MPAQTLFTCRCTQAAQLRHPGGDECTQDGHVILRHCLALLLPRAAAHLQNPAWMQSAFALRNNPFLTTRKAR